MTDPGLKKEDAITERFKRLSDNFEERCRQIDMYKARSRGILEQIEEVEETTIDAVEMAKLKITLADKEHELEITKRRNIESQRQTASCASDIEGMSEYLGVIDGTIMTVVDRINRISDSIHFHSLEVLDDRNCEKERNLMGHEDLRGHLWVLQQRQACKGDSTSLATIRRKLAEVRQERTEASNILTLLEEEHAKLKHMMAALTH